MALTKNELVHSIYEKTELPKKHCLRLVESAFEIIKSELENGNPVKISGFGKWTVRAKKKRNGRNPQTGEKITLDARKVILFRSSYKLRDELKAE